MSSLSVSLRPLPTLNACQSVPIQWTYAGSAAGELKLVFVSAAPSPGMSVSSSVSVPRSASAAAPTPSPSRTPSTRASSAATAPTTSPTSRTTDPASRTLRRRAVTPSSALTKTVTTVPLSYTSIGWAPIALPSGTYDLAAYLVPASSGDTERVVGTLRGVKVVQGSDNSCLSSSGSIPSNTSSAAGTTSSGSQRSAGVPASGGSTVDSTSSTNESEATSNKGPIIGGVVGAVLGSALLALLVYFCIIRPRRRRRRNHHHPSPLRPATGDGGLGGWFSSNRRRRRAATGEKETRGVGSAFGWDFGTLGSTTAAGGVVRATDGSQSRTEAAENPTVSSVSGPISATHVQGFQGYGNPLQRNEQQLRGATAFGHSLSPANYTTSHRNAPPPPRPVHPISHIDDDADYAEKDPEKAFPVRQGAIEMVPVLPRMNTAFIPPSEHDFRRVTTTGDREFFPEQEILASTSPSPVYFDASPFGHEHASENTGGRTTNAPSSQGHENTTTTTTLSDSSHTTGNSHAHLMYHSRPQNGTTNLPPDVTRRASAVLPDDIFGLPGGGGGVQRRPSGATTTLTSGSQRRRSSAAMGIATTITPATGGGGGGVERSTSVRRKPVPPVGVGVGVGVVEHAYEGETIRQEAPPPPSARRAEEGGGCPLPPPPRPPPLLVSGGAGGSMPAVGLDEGSQVVPRALAKQKSFVLDVDRPLVQ